MTHKKILLNIILILLGSVCVGQNGNFNFATKSSNDSTQVRNVLFEEFTGIWCGWCPRGHGILKDILNEYDNVIPVVIHGGEKEEPMRTPAGDQLVLDLETWFPTAAIDRYVFPGQEIILNADSDWKHRVEERLTHPSIATVSVEKIYDDLTRELSLTVNLNFVKGGKGDFRFNAYILEDNLIYTQENNLNENEGYPDLFGKGDPIVGYVHDHVLRKMLGGPYGINPDDETGIPESVSAGQSYSHTFTTTINPNFKATDIHLVAYVLDYDGPHGKEILNSVALPLIETSVDRISLEKFLKVYPNPSDGIFNIIYDSNSDERVEILVSNMQFQKVHSQNWHKPAGNHSFSIRLEDLPDGIYLLQLKSGKVAHYERIVIVR